MPSAWMQGRRSPPGWEKGRKIADSTRLLCLIMSHTSLLRSYSGKLMQIASKSGHHRHHRYHRHHGHEHLQN